jgi:hypothetical protein
VNARLPESLRTWSIEQWREALSGDLFGDGRDNVRPLVVTNDRLYFDRYVRLEREAARQVTPRTVE